MVYFIRTRKSINDSLSKIVKTMINIERNQHIFDLNGNLNNSQASKNPFNVFTYNNIDFEVSVSIGVLLIYTNEDTNSNYCVMQLVSEFQRLADESYANCGKLPINYSGYKSTYYTMVSRDPSYIQNTTTNSTVGVSFRKIVSSNNNVKKCIDDGTRFVWLVQVISNNNYLTLHELAERMPNKTYLMRSASTIIYDQSDLFNVPTDTKQLDYPYIHQYTLFSQNRLLEKPVIIGEAYGIAYEIASYYNTDELTIKSPRFLSRNNPRGELVDYNNIKLRRINTAKHWYLQIQEKFDHEKQELQEQQSEEIGKPPFRVDICFITHAPIYKYCYILKVGKNINNLADPVYENITHIMVSPSIYSSYFSTNLDPTMNFEYKNIFEQYFNYMTGYTIIDLYITLFPRTELEAIELIPKNKISEERCNLLKCISINGCCVINTEGYNYNVFTADLDRKIVYAGFYEINDKILFDYKNSNTVLFGVKFDVS